nr:hypothetical protein [uncultured Bacteroides sp.]
MRNKSNMKAKIRKTGEVVDVITYSGHTYRSDIDVVSYIDSKGNEYVDMKMNRFLDFEDVEESLIDWEERRFELIKAAMQGNLPTSAFDKETFCKYCISIADEMITQLNS